MNKTNDGGPAFPITDWGRTQKGELAQYQKGGMSKREWFAGQALAGLDLEEWSTSTREHTAIAEHCVGVADALIAELNKEPTQ